MHRITATIYGFDKDTNEETFQDMFIQVECDLLSDGFVVTDCKVESVQIIGPVVIVPSDIHADVENSIARHFKLPFVEMLCDVEDSYNEYQKRVAA